MTNARTRGAANRAAGRASRAAGRAMEDVSTSAEGFYDHATGAAQRVYGQALEAASDAVDTGQRYYRESNRAVSRQIEDQSIPVLLLVAVGSFALGWFARGEDR